MGTRHLQSAAQSGALIGAGAIHAREYPTRRSTQPSKACGNSPLAAGRVACFVGCLVSRDRYDSSGGRSATVDDQTARVQTKRSQTGHEQPVTVAAQIARMRPVARMRPPRRNIAVNAFPERLNVLPARSGTPPPRLRRESKLWPARCLRGYASRAGLCHPPN